MDAQDDAIIEPFEPQPPIAELPPHLRRVARRVAGIVSEFGVEVLRTQIPLWAAEERPIDPLGPVDPTDDRPAIENRPVQVAPLPLSLTFAGKCAYLAAIHDRAEADRSKKIVPSLDWPGEDDDEAVFIRDALESTPYFVLLSQVHEIPESDAPTLDDFLDVVGGTFRERTYPFDFGARQRLYNQAAEDIFGHKDWLTKRRKEVAGRGDAKFRRESIQEVVDRLHGVIERWLDEVVAFEHRHADYLLERLRQIGAKPACNPFSQDRLSWWLEKLGGLARDTPVNVHRIAQPFEEGRADFELRCDLIENERQRKDHGAKSGSNRRAAAKRAAGGKKKPGRKAKNWEKRKADLELVEDWERFKAYMQSSGEGRASYTDFKKSRGLECAVKELKSRIEGYYAWEKRLAQDYARKPSHQSDADFAELKAPGLPVKELRGLLIRARRPS